MKGASSLSSDDCQLLVDSVVDYAIFMLDQDGRIATWNPGAEHIKGYSAGEIIGRHFSIFYPPEDVAAGKPERELAVATEVGRFEEEVWRVRKDGSLFWANVTITALRDDAGRLRGFGKVTRDLTDRRQAEERLQHSEERFQLLVEAVTDYAIYLLDIDGRVVSWNLGAERMKGYRAEQILGKHFEVFFSEEDAARGKPAQELSIARSEGRVEDEGWRIRRDGTRFWANAVLTAIRDPQGKLRGFVKITRDLTGRRASEEVARRLLKEQTARETAQEGERRLRESEERYRALSRRLEIILEGVADGITAQDRSGRVVFANSAAARLCGMNSPEELMNTPITEVLSRFEMLDVRGRPFDPDELPGRRVLAGAPASSALMRVRERVGGREWWTQIRASAVLDAQGTAELVINIWHDVTSEQREERRAQYLAATTAALGSSLDPDAMLTNLARALVPGLADWCVIHLLEGEQLRHVTSAHADPSQLAATCAYVEKFPPNPELSHGVWSVARSGRPELVQIGDTMLVEAARSPEQLELLRGAGMKALLCAPIRLRDKVLGVLTLVSCESAHAYDASDMALVEELARRAGVALDNARLYAAAQASAKAAEEASRAKDEFLATVSHELRTPLSAIFGWATLLRERAAEPTWAKAIEAIYRNAQAQVRIIDDILDVSRVITGKFRLDAKPADLGSIVQQAMDVVRPSAVAKKIELVFAPDEDCLLVADAERLQQVVWNLLSNAIKFTESGGKVSLSLRREGSSVVLSVSDTGIGIDPAFLPFVFERFKQADSSTTRRVGGLGLGLALVRHIVELHGGQVAAASEGRGAGATFSITLPIRAVVPPAPDSVPPPPDTEARLAASDLLSGVRVLVVDDEQDARELVAAVLLQAGAVVETARSAADGFEAFERVRPDVLVSDVGMPDEDGYSFIRRLRALPAASGGRVPALALTAFAREEDRTRAIAAGYTTHIGKPVNPGVLAAAVANLAALGRPR